jgi:hypothetical protein
LKESQRPHFDVVDLEAARVAPSRAPLRRRLIELFLRLGVVVRPGLGGVAAVLEAVPPDAHPQHQIHLKRQVIHHLRRAYPAHLFVEGRERRPPAPPLDVHQVQVVGLADETALRGVDITVHLVVDHHGDLIRLPDHDELVEVVAPGTGVLHDVLHSVVARRRTAPQNAPPSQVPAEILVPARKRNPDLTGRVPRAVLFVHRIQVELRIDPVAFGQLSPDFHLAVLEGPFTLRADLCRRHRRED